MPLGVGQIGHPALAGRGTSGRERGAESCGQRSQAAILTRMWFAARRALTILREMGPATLWWKVLGELGYRRAILFERELGRGVRLRASPAPVELGMLDTHEADAYLRFHPESSRLELERRLGAGDWCHVARVGTRLVGVRWVSLREARVAHLGFSFPLAETEAFVYDLFIDPGWRGRGVARALYFEMNAHLESEGFTKVLSAVLPENPKGIAFTSSTSDPRATLVSIGLGKRRRHFRRPPPKMSEEGRLTPVVELLILAARLSGRPRAVAALHGVLAAPRHLRVRARRYGDRLDGEVGQVVCAGRERRFRALLDGHTAAAAAGPLVSTFSPRALDALGADLTAAEIHPLAAPRFRRAGWTVVPELVRWRAPTDRLPPDPPSESLSSDLRKLDTAGFESETVTRPTEADWRTLEHEIVVPHVRRRFGAEAWIWSSAYMAAMRRRATLLFVTRDGRRLAGACLLATGGEVWMALAGVRDGDPNLMGEGALAALYAGTIEHARSSGAGWVDVGSTSANLDDGLARYKRKWGFSPAEDPLSPLVAVRVAAGPAGVARAFGSSRMLVATDVGLVEVTSARA